MAPMEHKLMSLPLRAGHTDRSDNVIDLCTTGACRTVPVPIAYIRGNFGIVHDYDKATYFQITSCKRSPVILLFDKT
jgi:hypothetical protein